MRVSRGAADVIEHVVDMWELTSPLRRTHEPHSLRKRGARDA